VKKNYSDLIFTFWFKVINNSIVLRWTARLGRINPAFVTSFYRVSIKFNRRGKNKIYSFLVGSNFEIFDLSSEIFEPGSIEQRLYFTTVLWNHSTVPGG